VDGGGKGETVNVLHTWMDARFLQTRAFDALSDEEKERPDFWRYWMALPPKGRIGIFFGSWYTDPIVNRAHRLIKQAEMDSALARINTFEKELVDDGALIVKLWFHLSRKAQKERLESLASHRATRWRVTPLDWKNFKLYHRFRRVSERVLRETSTSPAPWFIIEGVDHHYRTLAAAEYLHNALRSRLGSPSPARANSPAIRVRNPVTILDKLDLSLSLGKKQYERDLEKYQGRLNNLVRKAKKHKQSTVLVFEGWDAAGKGSAIRRITGPLDARDYQVIPIAAPTDEEKAHHYLWRFWRHLPRAGRVTIFDRSWYGRVLVERVEGFATEVEWKRAYPEINDFEEQLNDHKTLVLKFWLHISKDEQLRRFKEREETAFKTYKITEEDFRNRKKWNAYEAAANEMIERTSTEFAPWSLVEANDKHFARMKILETICEALKKAL
jgi:polyphosphate:AMP phosphotransferase